MHPDAEPIAIGVDVSPGRSALNADTTTHRTALGAVAEERGEPKGENRMPRTMSDRGLLNIVAFGKLLGLVQYFHPSDQAAAAEWDSLAIDGVARVEGARNPAELRDILIEMFGPIAPTIRISVAPLSPLVATALRGEGDYPDSIVGWWYRGWADGERKGVYFRRRFHAPLNVSSENVLPIGSECNVALGGGVYCSVPLTVYADTSGTIPHRKAIGAPQSEWGTWAPSGEDRSTRIADILLFWNATQHFYPYFDVIATNWIKVLETALRTAAVDRTGAAFELTLRKMVARLEDGHGSVNSPYGDPRPMPLLWRFVGRHLIVVRADSAIAGRVYPGDEVVGINGRPIGDWVERARQIKSAATQQFLDIRVAQALQVIPGGDSALVQLRSPEGKMRAAWVPRRPGALLKPERPDSIVEIRPGVLYLDLDRVTDADFTHALPAILAARGVVFDMRGYPGRLSTIVIAHLRDTPARSGKWYIPIVRRPDRQGTEFEPADWLVHPLPPRVTCRVAFVIDGGAISYAETLLGMVEHYKLGALVGEATAGTNGNLVTQYLPGGYVITWTAMKVLKQDGSRHHGIGVVPTVACSPTIGGIAARRDEQLERAIEVVSRR